MKECDNRLVEEGEEYYWYVSTDLVTSAYHSGAFIVYVEIETSYII